MATMSTEMTKVYLYGIADFWLTMLEDPALADALLEADLTVFASMYSQFLQTTSGISLEDIAIAARSDIRLIPIVRTVPVGFHPDGSAWPEENTLVLPEPYQSIKFLANTPLVPSLLLSEGADFAVDEQLVDGKVVSSVTFARPLTEYPIPYKVVDYNGQPRYMYMLWAEDCALDLQLISQIYAPLVEQSPQVSTALFKKYIEGLLYLYTNGPTLNNLKNGLCLAFGIPTCRLTGEIVLLVGQNTLSGSHWVMTTLDTYTLPYGIQPQVAEGEVMSAGQAFASIVEVDDYLSRDNWWLNMYIPEEVISSTGSGLGMVATPGSDTDLLMRQFLKSHLFVVQIKWQPGHDLGDASQLSPILRRAKPAHTFALLVITQNIGNDLVTVTDSESHNLRLKLLDFMTPPLYIHRDPVSNEQVLRGTAYFMRSNVDEIDSAILPDMPVYDDPPVTITNVIGGGTLVTTSQDLQYFYSCTEAEAKLKLAHLGHFIVTPLPYSTATTEFCDTDPVVLTRNLAALPVSAGDYRDTGTELGDALADGWTSELMHHYYEPVVDPVTLVLIKPAHDLDLVNVYVNLPGSTDLQLPVPRLDTLSAYYYDDDNPTHTKHTLLSGV